MFLIPLFVRWGLSGRLAKLAAYVTTALAVVALLGGLWLWLSAREEADDKANQDIGGAVQREADRTETIKRIERANDAEDKLSNPDARRDGCLRHSRTPANC